MILFPCFIAASPVLFPYIGAGGEGRRGRWRELAESKINGKIQKKKKTKKIWIDVTNGIMDRRQVYDKVRVVKDQL